MADLEAAGGLPTILVNNAGIARDALILRMKSEDWEQTLPINLTAVFRLSKACLRRMLKERHGRIINIGSVVGVDRQSRPGPLRGRQGRPGRLHQGAGAEVATRNITVNTVAPGFIETDMTRALQRGAARGLPGADPGRPLRHAPRRSPTAVLFLASREAGYITGQTLHVNGGMYMG